MLPFRWFDRCDKGWGALMIRALHAIAERSHCREARPLPSTTHMSSGAHAEPCVDLTATVERIFDDMERPQYRGQNPPDNLRVDAVVAAALAASPRLATLTTLDLSDYARTAGGVGIGPMGVRALAASPHVSALTHLDLSDNDVGDEGVRALTASPFLSNLTHLTLGRNEIGPAGARALSVSPYITALTQLDLSGNNVGDEGAIVLAASSLLSGLIDLDLSYNDIGDDGAWALATSPSVATLTTLGLAGHAFTDASVLALAKSPYVAMLKTLALDGNSVYLAQETQEALLQVPFRVTLCGGDEYACRVCGYRWAVPPWGFYGDAPTYFFCYCCGIEAGLDDRDRERILRWRREWLAHPEPWLEPRAKPAHWDVQRQLISIPVEYR